MRLESLPLEGAGSLPHPSHVSVRILTVMYACVYNLCMQSCIHVSAECFESIYALQLVCFITDAKISQNLSRMLYCTCY